MRRRKIGERQSTTISTKAEGNRPWNIKRKWTYDLATSQGQKRTWSRKVLLDETLARRITATGCTALDATTHWRDGIVWAEEGGRVSKFWIPGCWEGVVWERERERERERFGARYVTSPPVDNFPIQKKHATCRLASFFIIDIIIIYKWKTVRIPNREEFCYVHGYETGIVFIHIKRTHY